MKTIHNLEVIINVTKSSQANTYDNIWLDIGQHRWKLYDKDRKNSNKGLVGIYHLNTHEDFSLNDFSRILLCKEPDAKHTKWHLDGIIILLDGKIIYDNSEIHQWLDDEKSGEWLAPDFTSTAFQYKSILISEEEVKKSVHQELNNLFFSGTWNHLSLKGDLTVDVQCQHILISQNFEANIKGPKPVLTLWMKLVPYAFEQKIEVRIRSYEVFAEYPWWLEIATLGISNLMEVHIQGGIKKKIKDIILELLQHITADLIEENSVKQISLRPHKVEILY